MSLAWFRSLAGQLAALLALALLVAQAISFALLWQSRERLREAQFDIAIDRVVSLVDREVVLDRLVRRSGRDRSAGPRWARAASVTETREAEKYRVRQAASSRLVRDLRTAEKPADGALVAVRDFRPRDPSPEGRPRGDDPARGEGSIRDLLSRSLVAAAPRRAMVLSVPLEEGRWLNVISAMPPEAELRVLPLLVQTALIYVVLLAPVLFMARQLSRPLSRLRDASRTMMTNAPPVQLTPEGPQDVRELTAAFTDMRGRIEKLFEEKDVMLGALGHDLRTPLTSLRIRVEAVDDAVAREKMIATIDELAAQLEEILDLARNGKSDEPAQLLDLDDVLERVKIAFPDAADRLTVGTTPTLDVAGHPMLLTRALRNLVDNGLRYGGRVELLAEVVNDSHGLAFIVRDDGPGLDDPQDTERLKQAFVRGDGSRNRNTGGAGLGLALADRVAAAHGGSLTLQNRPEGGLRATLTIPTIR